MTSARATAFDAPRPAMAHRPEIDGLRALAIVPVVLFHAGFAGFSGGYVGVDVFFVISGYLITSIILREQQAGRFSLASFFERRARRILPPLFALLAVVVPLALAWMSPVQLKSFAGSLAALSVFVSNLFFWRNNGYFDPVGDEKVLLHTWSLSVEEQFYLVFPAFIVLAWRAGTRRLGWAILSIALLSLGFSQWCAMTGRANTNFFFTPSRVWELMAGALCALAMPGEGFAARAGAAVRDLLAAVGLVLILGAAVAYDRATPFPGVYALAPVLGTALVILFAGSGGRVGRLLASRALVAIGLVSYSLYLWHQPLFAFARILSEDEPRPVVFALLCVASAVLAWLSWRLVEAPFRDRRRFSRRRIFAWSAAGALAFGATGAALHANDGFLRPLDPMQRQLLAYDYLRDAAYFRDGCFLPDARVPAGLGDCTHAGRAPARRVFLWGDSHAAHLLPGLQAGAQKFATLTALTASACAPIPGLKTDGRPDCDAFNRQVLERIARDRPDTVILAAAWGRYPWEQVALTVKALRERGVARIDLVGPVPEWRYALPYLLAGEDRPLAQLPRRTATGLEPHQRGLSDTMKRFAADLGVNYLAPRDVLCNAGGCLTRLGDTPDQVVTWDSEHLTPAGSRYLVERLDW